ncbi:IS3 family transposase, partial [Streptomyces sp. SID13031]|uniref:IS3 family transposase n=1 Tax=Streptomyces sp. SID13031 TaxID=2706046 RepID=UPI0013CD6247|nr:hypothetical protein [Streptomyces sp. SID13031]
DPVNCYPFIEAEKAGNHNIARACELLKVSRSAYYADRTNPGSRHARRDVELTAKIVEIHEESQQACGFPRVRHELRDQGQQCSRTREPIEQVGDLGDPPAAAGFAVGVVDLSPGVFRGGQDRLLDVLVDGESELVPRQATLAL